METNAEHLIKLINEEGVGLIQRMVEEHYPETRFLDFKRKSDSDGLVQPCRSDMENYVKALSGFANSEGGVLIWGVGEKRLSNGKVAYDKCPITNVEHFVIRLNNLLPGAVSKPVDGVSNFSVKASGQSSGYVVTYVPQSPMAPHRGELKLKSYFQRIGDNFVQMEHFQIEDMFGRRQQPHVSASFGWKKGHSPDPNRIHKYELVLKLANDGRSMASYVGVDFEFPQEALRDENSSPYGIQIDNSYSETKPGLSLLRYRNNPNEEGKAPLFPGETIRVTPNNFLGGHLNYHINDAIHYAWEGKEFLVRVYADSAPAIESVFKFSDISNF